MTPLSLTLTGFKGIRDGLGRETISINFAELTQGAELVAITGRNGRGKSTILDNMSPYPVMPSKAGGDGLAAFSYYDEVYLPESQKEFVWEMQGNRYRSQLVIRGHGKRRTEAYLHKYTDERWLPVRLEDGTVSDGRMETYQRCVEGIAGNCATFLTTAFSAQNRRQLSAYRNAEIKSLLADLLGLDQISALGNEASETLRLIRAGLLTLRQTRTELESERMKLTDLRASLGGVEKQADLARQNKAIAAERRDARRTELATLTAQRDMARCHEERRAQLMQERQSAINAHRSGQSQLDDMERATREALQRHHQRVAARTAQRNTQIASLRSQATCLHRTIHGGRHVERAVRRQLVLKAILRERDEAMGRWERAAARQESLRGEVAVKESQLAARAADVAQAKNRLLELEEQIAATDLAEPSEVISDQIEMQALQGQLHEAARRREEQTGAHRASLAGIDRLLAALPPAFDDAALARAVSSCAQAEAFLQNADKALAAAVAAAQREADISQRLLVYEGKCLELDQQIGRIEKEIANWTLFAKCMGNDGIIALAIDDAGPELSALANQLLLACYGPRFTVSIKTQLATAKGDLKEGFEITVHDACRDTTKNVAKMSGGERIWINECLTRAMALYLAEASSCRSSTLFSDEADGAFDAQHKRQFMAMKREVLRIGGYAQEYFISHTPELSAMADAVIDLDLYAMQDNAPVA